MITRPQKFQSISEAHWTYWHPSFSSIDFYSSLLFAAFTMCPSFNTMLRNIYRRWWPNVTLKVT